MVTKLIFWVTLVRRHRFWLVTTKLTFWMTLCPSSYIFAGDQTQFSFFEWPFVRRNRFSLMTKLLFRFLIDTLSVFTGFHWSPNSFFISSKDPLSVDIDFLLVTKLTFERSLYPSSHFLWSCNSLFEASLCPSSHNTASAAARRNRTPEIGEEECHLPVCLLRLCVLCMKF